MVQLALKLLEFILQSVTLRVLMMTLLLSIFVYLAFPDFLLAWLQTRFTDAPVWVPKAILSFTLSFFAIDGVKMLWAWCQIQKYQKLIQQLNPEEIAILRKFAGSGFATYPLPDGDPAVISLASKSIIRFVEPSVLDFTNYRLDKYCIPALKKYFAK